MHVRCPHCHQPVELVENLGPEHLDCPSCGTAFNVSGDPPPAFWAYHCEAEDGEEFIAGEGLE